MCGDNHIDYGTFVAYPVQHLALAPAARPVILGFVTREMVVVAGRVVPVDGWAPQIATPEPG